MQDGRAIAISGSPGITSPASSVSLRGAADPAERDHNEPPRELHHGPDPQHREKRAVNVSLAPQLAVVFSFGRFLRAKFALLPEAPEARLWRHPQRLADHYPPLPGNPDSEPCPVVLH